MLTQLSRPVRELAPGVWQFSYFEGLMEDHRQCKAAAESIATILSYGGPKIQLKRCNIDLQAGAECGFRTVYWAEELCRRRRNEGSWTFPYNVAQQASRIDKVVKKLRDERTKA